MKNIDQLIAEFKTAVRIRAILEKLFEKRSLSSKSRVYFEMLDEATQDEMNAQEKLKDLFKSKTENTI